MPLEAIAGNHLSYCREADEGQSDDGRRPRPAASWFGEAPERPNPATPRSQTSPTRLWQISVQVSRA